MILPRTMEAIAKPMRELDNNWRSRDSVEMCCARQGLATKRRQTSLGRESEINIKSYEGEDALRIMGCGPHW